MSDSTDLLSVQIHFNLGNLHAKCNNYTKALDHYTSVLHGTKLLTEEIERRKLAFDSAGRTDVGAFDERIIQEVQDMSLRVEQVVEEFKWSQRELSGLATLDEKLQRMKNKLIVLLT